ncbi:glucokinase [Luteimonas sp. SDU101]|uniref:glucokinase n=1 Tax=Luteimonas sp. SDU101 TaxID=3422593 RepID=UPI003EBE564B
MGASTRHLSVSPGPRRGAATVLAADVGGTHVRVGLVDVASPQSLQHYRRYACADFAGLGELLQAYVSSVAAAATVRHGVLASAGHAREDGSLLSVNLPWPVVPSRIQAALGFEDLRLVNDFEALAHAGSATGTHALLHLSGPEVAPAGPVLVVGPGTGLGAAVRIAGRDGQAQVLATEAGQASLTVSTELELAVLREFLRERSHVPNEHALSGPGLLRLHGALARVRGEAPTQSSPDAISAAAATGDALARDTLALFCGLLGGAVGDMALLYGARGGVQLAGGILPQIREFLAQSSFVARFLDKGPMRESLLRIPVTLVEHGQLGAIGAASWYLDQCRNNNGCMDARLT